MYRSRKTTQLFPKHRKKSIEQVAQYFTSEEWNFHQPTLKIYRLQNMASYWLPESFWKSSCFGQFIHRKAEKHSVREVSVPPEAWPEKIRLTIKHFPCFTCCLDLQPLPWSLDKLSTKKGQVWNLYKVPEKCQKKLGFPWWQAKTMEIFFPCWTSSSKGSLYVLLRVQTSPKIHRSDFTH